MLTVANYCLKCHPQVTSHKCDNKREIVYFPYCNYEKIPKMLNFFGFFQDMLKNTQVITESTEFFIEIPNILKFSTETPNILKL